MASPAHLEWLGMPWELSWRADPRGAALMDRHYSRQKIGAAQFMPPGGCCVLYAGRPGDGEALWGLSTPFARYVKHAWAGAWMCSVFRNEGAGLSSQLIREACAATLAVLGPAPSLGIVTFVDAGKTAARRGRKSRVGECFLRAGFRHVGHTKGGLWAFQLLSPDMPRPISPHGHAGACYLGRAA